MVRELCKYRFRAAFGVWALRCGGAPFGRFPSRLRRRGAHLGGGCAAVGKLPRGERTGSGGLLCKGASAFGFALPHPALGASPISGQGHGSRQVAAERTHGQGRGLPAALPPLRTGIRHNKRHCSARKRHCSARKRQCSAHRRHCSARKRHDSAQQAAWFGTARGRVRLCLRPPPPCARRRGPRCHNGARANPLYIARANPILYIRVRRREGENVLHRAASNDVDNFSVDNPLWITVAGGCRLLRGHRRRRCGGSVNAGTAF